MKRALRILGICAGLLGVTAGVAFATADAPGLQPIVSGSAHQALFSIAFNGNVGVAVGAGGELLESSDAGKSWKAVAAQTPLALLGVGLAPGHAIVVGQSGLIMVMDSRGKWKKVGSGTKHRLFNVVVKPNGLAVAVGAYGTILKSTDGGNTWNSIAPNWQGYTKYGDQPHLYGVDVDDKGRVTVCGELGLIIRSSDDGKTWQTLHKGNEDTSVGVSSLFALQVRPDGVAYAVGQNGTILRSSDDGKTWDKLDSDTHSILLGVHAEAGGRVIVTGLHDMLVSQDGGNSWRHVGGEDVTSSWLEGLATPGPNQAVFAVGAAGRIVRVVIG